MPDGQHRASSHRLTRLAPKLADKAYRNSYVAHQTRQFLARQVRKLRGDKSQTEFGELLGKPQSVVSRLEDPNYGKWALQTLFDVAASLDRAVIVRIVDYPTFLRFTSDMTDAAARPKAYEQDAVDSLAQETSVGAAIPGATSPTQNIFVWFKRSDQEESRVSFNWPTSPIRGELVINLSSTSDEEFERILVQERKRIALIPSAQIRVAGHG